VIEQGLPAFEAVPLLVGQSVPLFVSDLTASHGDAGEQVFASGPSALPDDVLPVFFTAVFAGPGEEISHKNLTFRVNE